MERISWEFLCSCKKLNSTSKVRKKTSFYPNFEDLSLVQLVWKAELELGKHSQELSLYM